MSTRGPVQKPDRTRPCRVRAWTRAVLFLRRSRGLSRAWSGQHPALTGSVVLPGRTRFESLRARPRSRHFVDHMFRFRAAHRMRTRSRPSGGFWTGEVGLCRAHSGAVATAAAYRPSRSVERTSSWKRPSVVLGSGPLWCMARRHGGGQAAPRADHQALASCPQLQVARPEQKG